MIIKFVFSHTLTCKVSVCSASPEEGEGRRRECSRHRGQSGLTNTNRRQEVRVRGERSGEIRGNDNNHCKSKQSSSHSFLPFGFSHGTPRPVLHGQNCPPSKKTARKVLGFSRERQNHKTNNGKKSEGETGIQTPPKTNSRPARHWLSHSRSHRARREHSHGTPHRRGELGMERPRGTRHSTDATTIKRKCRQKNGSGVV